VADLGSKTRNQKYHVLTLAYMASKGVIPKNINPTSILMEDSTEIKVINFNLAIFVDSPKENFRTCGTPGELPLKSCLLKENKI